MRQKAKKKSYELQWNVPQLEASAPDAAEAEAGPEVAELENEVKTKT